MPDLKNLEDKPYSKQRSFEPHEKDDFTVVKKQEDNKKSASTAYSKSWLAIVCSMMVVFSIMLFLFVSEIKRKIKTNHSDDNPCVIRLLWNKNVIYKIRLLVASKLRIK